MMKGTIEHVDGSFKITRLKGVSPLSEGVGQCRIIYTDVGCKFFDFGICIGYLLFIGLVIGRIFCIFICLFQLVNCVLVLPGHLIVGTEQGGAYLPGFFNVFDCLVYVS